MEATDARIITVNDDDDEHDDEDDARDDHDDDKCNDFNVNDEYCDDDDECGFADFPI